ncbi:DNA packaging protein UL33 [Common bottlenose dolphin gammaherpesvirus 1 strain Sarasota]|uniref:DNA packaging protein UL33 n=1 Tax=Common bottlenose dolphin gammaherpesvirus 1 strain Sarasota TaxID=2022783 RepID=A0A1Z1NEI3_9GAMA|nr:DNA packaging protein UL33 [Common bottlenose dolphin gammaherpesvirus 1 strain Sarasota]ARW78130.1 DNA packaging protein UL33 [Common bottlenose dolphin gammaherpesvirus 1 strain Sarasota]
MDTPLPGDLHHLLAFDHILPPDIYLIAPTIYARFNALNHCQNLKAFARLRQHATLPRGREDVDAACRCNEVLEAKIRSVRQIISKIVETDTVLDTIQVADE